MGQKLLFYNCGSIGWLACYGITEESKPWDIFSQFISATYI